jgi:hypothetical protein
MPPSGTAPYTVKFLAQLRRPSQVPSILNAPLDRSLKQYLSGGRKARERTSAGPSGLHFGHIIANTTQPELAEVDR